MLNLADIEAYFRFLAPNDNLFTVAYLDAESKAACSPYGVWTGKLEELLEVTNQLYHAKKATLHATLNSTNDSGRRKADMRAARVLAIDLDTPWSASNIQGLIDTYHPGMIVATSPGKYHVYWQIESTIPLDRWSIYQLTLAYHFQADWRLSEVNKTLRVPGVPRLTKDKSVFLPIIAYQCPDCICLNEASLLEVFPFLATEQEAAVSWKKDLIDQERKLSKQLQKHLNGNGHSKLEVPEGASRNTALFKKAFHEAARFAPNTEPLSEDGLYQIIMQANSELSEPLDETELQGIVQSAYARGSEVREQSVAEFNLKKLEPTGGFVYDYDDEFLRINRFSNLALVSRIFQKFKDRILRVDKNIYAFDVVSCTWKLQENDSSEFNLFYKSCVQDMVSDPEFVATFCLTDSGEFSHKKYRQATDKFLSLQNYRAVTAGLKGHSDIEFIEHGEFDAQEHVFHAKNGLLDMLTGELRRAQPSDRLFAQSPVAYDPNAECPLFLEFLSQVFSENDDQASMIAFIQQLFGYTISGSLREQKIFLHFGAGSNGKSKLLSALRYIGGDYYTPIDPDQMTGSKIIAFERLAAKIEGKRIAVVDDMETEGVWNEVFVKNVTADQFRARAEHQRSRPIANRAKMHLAVNSPPRPQTETHGFLRRLCIINYPRLFEATTEESTRIDDLIKSELPGILAWSVEGFKLWVQNKGLQYPNETILALDTYKKDNFVLPAVLETNYEVSQDGSGIFTEDLLKDVQEVLRIQGTTNKRSFTRNELITAIRNTFKLESKPFWDPDKQSSRKGYTLIRKTLNLQ